MRNESDDAIERRMACEAAKRIERKVVCGQLVDVVVYPYQEPKTPDIWVIRAHYSTGVDTFDNDATYSRSPAFHLKSQVDTLHFRFK